MLASNSATIYMFRSSREGGFLRQMLRNFKGVLVSDFFSAYDGLPCLQQRCLIHLMRDLNRAILGNPFDQRVQSITGPFGVLLRSIVTTIDQHGLKQRHLQTHIKAADIFLMQLRSEFTILRPLKPSSNDFCETANASSHSCAMMEFHGTTIWPRMPLS